MNPEIVLSLFSVHLSIVATPRGAVGTFAFTAGTGLVAGVGAASTTVSFVSGELPPIPKREKVGLGFDGAGASSACEVSGFPNNFALSSASFFLSLSTII